jgi:hypothetical protein
MKIRNKVILFVTKVHTNAIFHGLFFDELMT